MNGHSSIGLLEGLGLGPEASDEGMCGLTFMNCSNDANGFPAVYCDTTRAISLLQAELLRRGAPIETAPLCQSGGSVLLKVISFGEAAILVEVVEDGGMDGNEFLQTSHPTKALHRPLSSSEWQV